MSQETMTPEQAYDVLVAEVHAPRFFQKLASVYGIEPASAQEAHDMLQLAGQLRNVHEAETVKQAAQSRGFVAEAKADLQKVLSQHGYAAPADNTYKQAAAQYAKTPVVQEAALVFQQHLAQAR